MKKQSRILIITNLLLLLGYLNWSIYQKEQTLRDGQLVLFELAPVDPRSLMQGDYMYLLGSTECVYRYPADGH